jgi:hypothetical protein
MNAQLKLLPAEAAAELLARILYAEAGQRPLRAIEGLAALAINRAVTARACPQARTRFAGGEEASSAPRALLAVLRAPFQFAVRHPRHPLHARFARPAEGDAALAMCRRVAARALAGALPDPTSGGVLWHDEARQPDWALGRMPCAELGGLFFYRLP